MAWWLVSFLLGQALTSPHAPAGSDPRDDLGKPFKLEPASLFLTVGVDGKPSAIRCAPSVPGAICPILVKGVSAWTFAPGQRNARPEAMVSELVLELAAVPKPGGFGVQATDAGVSLARLGNDGSPDMTPLKLTPPRYPPEDLRLRHVGKVELELWQDAGAAHPRVGRMWLDGKPADGSERLVRATLDAVATWPKMATVPEERMVCHTSEFVLDKKAAPDTPSACKSQSADGFAVPKLLTDPKTASF